MPSGGSANGRARRRAAINNTQVVTREAVLRNVEKTLDARVASHFQLYRENCHIGVLDIQVLYFLACNRSQELAKEAVHLVGMLKKAQASNTEAEFRAWVQIDRKTRNGRTALWNAACLGYAEVLRAFHALGANIEWIDEVDGPSAGFTALQAAVRNKQPATVRALLELGAKTSTNVVDLAIRTSTVEILRELAAAGADVNAPRYNQRGAPVYPLTAAAENNRLDMMDELRRLGADKHESHCGRFNALAGCARTANAATVDYLVEMGVDPDKPYLWPPLMIALQMGNAQAAEALLRKRECAPGKAVTHVNVHTALRAAIENDCMTAFTALLPLVCAPDRACCTGCVKCQAKNPIHTALNCPELNCTNHTYTVRRRNGVLEMEHGMFRGTKEWSTARLGACAPPHFSLAVSMGNVRMVDAMLRLGVDLDLHDPIIRAAGSGHVQILKMLVDANADCDKCGHWTCLKAAAANGHADVLRLLYRFGVNLEAVDNNGRTALYHAVRKGHVEAARQLVCFGAKGLLSILADAARGRRWDTVHKMAHLAGPSWANLAVLHGREIAKKELAKTRARLHMAGKQEERQQAAAEAHCNAELRRARVLFEAEKGRMATEHKIVVQGLGYKVGLAEAELRLAKSTVEDTQRKLQDTEHRLAYQRDLASAAQDANGVLGRELHSIRQQLAGSQQARERAERDVRALQQRTAQAKSEGEDAASATECCVCMEARKSRVFLPCRHMAVCGACVDGITACPICRGVIAECIEVYV